MVRYDAGNGDGPQVYACGSKLFQGAWSESSWFRFDGLRWSSIADARLKDTGRMQTQYVWDPDGAGPQPSVLVAGGFLENARTGLAFYSQQGMDVIPFPLAWDRDLGIRQIISYQGPHDASPRLYVCGNYNGGIGAGVLNGRTISSIAGPGELGEAMLVHDDGTGPALYVAAHTSRGGPSALGGPLLVNIGRYDGAAWTSVGGGLPTSRPVLGLTSFDFDGAGPNPPVLAAICDDSVKLWDGANWATFSIPGFFDPVNNAFSGSAVVFDDGSGSALYLGSGAKSTSLVSLVYVLRPNTGAIQPLIGYEGSFYIEEPDWTGTLNLFVEDLGAGPQLLAAGSYMVTTDHFAPRRFYALTESGWADPGVNQSQTHPFTITDMTTLDPDGPGPLTERLYVCGSPDLGYNDYDLSPLLVGSVASWDGHAWAYMGDGLPPFGYSQGYLTPVYAFASGTFQGAPSLFASAALDQSSHTSTIFRYQGSSWAPVDNSRAFAGEIRAVTARLNSDDRLFAFGDEGVWQWNGSTWADVDPENPIPLPVASAVAFNDGSGNALFASGDQILFSWNVIKWNGSAWTDASAGLPPPDALASPYRLFVLGDRLLATSDSTIYTWSNSAWQPTGVNLPQFISPIGAADTGSGHKLFFSDSEDPYGVISIWSYSPATNTFALDSQVGAFNCYVPLPFSTVIGFVGKAIGYPVDGQPGVCFGGQFNGVGVRSEPNTPAGQNSLSAIPALSFARIGCSAPACPADFNHAGGVNVQDIFDFLSAWFARDPSSDINHVGGVNVEDVFAFLGAWFAGCP